MESNSEVEFSWGDQTDSNWNWRQIWSAIQCEYTLTVNHLFKHVKRRKISKLIRVKNPGDICPNVKADIHGSIQ